MKTKPILLLAQCRQVAEAAEAAALRDGCAVSIAIVDDGGHLLLHLRLDDGSPMSAHVAVEKARMAALARRETKLLEDAVNEGRPSLLSSAALKGLIEGGMPLIVDGCCVGAIGVSGAKVEQDTRLAAAGIAALRAND